MSDLSTLLRPLTLRDRDFPAGVSYRDHIQALDAAFYPSIQAFRQESRNVLLFCSICQGEVLLPELAEHLDAISEKLRYHQATLMDARTWPDEPFVQ